MALLFRACRRGDREDYDQNGNQTSLPRCHGGYGENLERCKGSHFNNLRAMESSMQRDSWCFRNPCLRRDRIAPNGPGFYASEMPGMQTKMPARSPNRKLTPYPGKTTSTLQHLETIAPSFSNMNRSSYKSDRFSSYSSSYAASRASSICANSGARPIEEKGGSTSNEDASGSKLSGSGTGTGSGSRGKDSRGTTSSGNSQYSKSSYESIDWSKPSSSLLEASMRRMAINEKAEMEALEMEESKERKKYPKPLKVFTESFFRGLANGNVQWASDEAVSEGFHEEARMVTHDGQMYYGRTGIVKRLNRGMDRLLKMLGERRKDSSKTLDTLDVAKLQEMGLECCNPVQEGDSTWRVVYNMKKGVLRYSFEDEFVLEEGKINKLTRRLIR